MKVNIEDYQILIGSIIGCFFGTIFNSWIYFLVYSIVLMGWILIDTKLRYGVSHAKGEKKI